jgi:hypothetical protein
MTQIQLEADFEGTVHDFLKFVHGASKFFFLSEVCSKYLRAYAYSILYTTGRNAARVQVDN